MDRTHCDKCDAVGPGVSNGHTVEVAPIECPDDTNFHHRFGITRMVIFAEAMGDGWERLDLCPKCFQAMLTEAIERLRLSAENT